MKCMLRSSNIPRAPSAQATSNLFKHNQYYTHTHILHIPIWCIPSIYIWSIDWIWPDAFIASTCMTCAIQTTFTVSYSHISYINWMINRKQWFCFNKYWWKLNTLSHCGVGRYARAYIAFASKLMVNAWPADKYETLRFVEYERFFLHTFISGSKCALGISERLL